ncbi:hypothetical protein [Hymenobacter cellulosivorans]|uniref:Uncharacterized protein n=1 Tax=Hymenobacter cellulosivorans TaxID=2932249 RepID=A0ABY4FCL4_9BACT|nr:hypothetical protein [Hymenobacter cellulosivorans]UOQ53732.1 hypothetical protein MUN80_02985 [Hymenobacter cellulosivorans]
MFTYSLHPVVRRFMLILLGWMLSPAAFAQHDAILRTNGEEIKAKILTVSPDTIHYVHLDPPSTDTLRIASADVFMLRYANGTREVIQHPVATSSAMQLSRQEAMQRGAADARKYFRAPGAFWGTYGATLLNPMAGLVTGVVVGNVRPLEYNLTAPDPNLLKNPDYVRGYQRQAKNKKLGKAVAGFGAGVGTLVVALAVLLTNSRHW